MQTSGKLPDALDFALETLGIEKPGLRDRLMTLYLRLEAFPEVPDVLKCLKQAGLQTAILSNGSPKMLAAAVEAAGLRGLLDSVLSVEEVGVISPIRRSINLPSIGSGYRLLQLHFNPRMLGMPMRPRHSECGLSGATATLSGASGCLATPTAR